ncbi:MAG: acyltransferase, partial [Chlorobiaceae bacterium]|nr:acyltransferase [Chlorobiaceae bacterium]
MELKYRSDIDGLRAIAVLSVLFFHTEVPGFSGGYVGVDVFFVISGFLITNIILKDIQEGRFSVARFYERRIRRIFPALFPVIFFVLVFGILFYYPSAMRDLGMSINTTTLFSSNIYFLRQSGYFDAAVIVKPLLHTWSLAVEEQFYIVFPLLLMFISRFLRGKYFPWLIVIFVLSFLGNIYFIKLKPDMVFYMMPTRAWELITGSMLAFGVFPVLLANWQKNLLSFSGIAMIMYSAIFYDSSTLFPGYAALLPVMGSGLVIYSGIGEGNYALYRILSFRPLVFIGLISYSLYLWHWSLVTFVKYIIFDQFNWIASLLIIIVSLVFAVLSWRYIEKPFRGKNSLVPDRKVLFIYAGLLMMVTVGIGTAIYATNGLYGFMTASEIFGTKKN